MGAEERAAQPAATPTTTSGHTPTPASLRAPANHVWPAKPANTHQARLLSHLPRPPVTSNQTLESTACRPATAVMHVGAPCRRWVHCPTDSAAPAAAALAGPRKCQTWTPLVRALPPESRPHRHRPGCCRRNQAAARGPRASTSASRTQAAAQLAPVPAPPPVGALPPESWLHRRRPGRCRQTGRCARTAR